MSPSQDDESLLRSLYVSLAERARPDVAPEIVLRQARAIASSATLPAAAWDAADSCTVRALRATGRLHRPARVAAHVVGIRTPHLAQVPGRSGAFEETLTTSLVLQDLAGDRIETLALTREPRVLRVVDEARLARTLEFLGVVVAIPSGPRKSERHFAFHVHEIRRGASTYDLLGATAGERKATRALLKKLHARRIRPLDYMVDALVRGIGVVGKRELPLLVQCLRFTALQALSGGRINHAAGKLHALIVGPPGQGKKLIGLAARLLNPRTSEASPSKISLAGLVGASYSAPDGWRSQPGLIPQAEDGVVLLQDAHGITPTEIAKIAPMLQELIEDGVLRDAKAGGVRREVSVGTIIDLNRTSQVQIGTARRRAEAAILGLRPLLSRLDLIAELPDDAARAWEVAAKLYATQSARRGGVEDEAWVRELRLLVAELRERHAEVSLSRVRKAMERAHRELAASSGGKLATLREAGDVPARLTISFARYVTASARASDRSAAEEVDVKEALAFLRVKLRFYGELAQAAEVAAVAPPIPLERAAFYGRFAGKTVRSLALAGALRKALGAAVSERTVVRDLAELGATRAAKGLYRVPRARA